MVSVDGPEGLVDVGDAKSGAFPRDDFRGSLDVLLLKVASDFGLGQDHVVDLFVYLDVLLLLLLALIEEPLAGLRQVIVVEDEGSSALGATKVATEAVVELLDVFLVDVLIAVGSVGLEGELVEHDLQNFMIVLVLLFFSGRLLCLVLLELLRLFLLLHCLLLLVFRHFLGGLLLLRLWLHFALFPFGYLYAHSQIEQTVSISQ